MPVLPRVTVSEAENLVGSGWVGESGKDDCLNERRAKPGSEAGGGANEEFAAMHRDAPVGGALGMSLHQKRIAEIGREKGRGRRGKYLFELFAEGGELLLHFRDFPS